MRCAHRQRPEGAVASKARPAFEERLWSLADVQAQLAHLWCLSLHWPQHSAGAAAAAVFEDETSSWWQAAGAGLSPGVQRLCAGSGSCVC